MYTENIDPAGIDYAVLSELFKIFGDETRLKILAILIDSEMSVGEIAEKLGMTQSAISHQLKGLRYSRLVKVRRDGKSMYYSLDDDHVKCILNCGLEHISEQ